MKNRKIFNIIYLLLFIFLLIGGTIKCHPESERFREKPATFWDGIWHGIIAPIYWFSDKDVEPARSTSGYIWGVRIGTGWTILFILIGMGVVADEIESNEVGCCLGAGLGCLGGMLIGAVIYWPIYGLVALIKFLVSATGAWFSWLFSRN